MVALVKVAFNNFITEIRYQVRGKQRRSENVSEKHFSRSRVKVQPWKQWKGSASLYGLEGLIRREVGNQRLCGPTMRAVQQGLLAGAAPPGEPSLSSSLVLCLPLALSLARSALFRGPLGLAGSRGSKTAG